MKKTIAVLLLSCLMLFTSALCPSAAGESTEVFVTISDGSLVLTLGRVTVTDTDGDGALTINDALFLAHDSFYEGGAAAGYASEKTTFGLSLTKLWGVANGGSYSYCVNNVPASSLADTVSDGDHIAAYLYTDTEGFSDVYCYFASFTASAVVGQPVTLTLNAVAYDESWQVIAKPVAGAELTVNGEKTGLVTDAEGKVTYTPASEGELIVSAVSESARLVPPVLALSVSPASPDSADGTLAVLALCAAALAAAGFCRGKRHEK